jgi:hypothetical protein
MKLNYIKKTIAEICISDELFDSITTKTIKDILMKYSIPSMENSNDDFKELKIVSQDFETSRKDDLINDLTSLISSLHENETIKNEIIDLVDLFIEINLKKEFDEIILYS